MDKDGARKLQRTRLIEARNALTDRQQIEARLCSRVLDWLTRSDCDALGFYFPIRSEADLRPAVAQWLTADARRVAALPAIDGELLRFHQWTPDAELQPGGYGVPVSSDGDLIQPQCLLVPCVGFDRARYRLGYGGGYYDRTLVALTPRPLAVGIAFEASRLESIDPRPHDVKLDLIITDAALY